ncbi:MAG: mechanosensitive ion channel family protein [Betaproteobacteria bacterium]|nr:mechanosensitive ion channel family protein [Betaproteobacteria bacterium]MDH5221897.1 mechanosensitive ion channel family protein [Betaproteobacteria bacterium]MDH5352165.1 mechanosensitive ion channel family protein [Betaproteobacteria bacterium]
MSLRILACAALLLPAALAAQTAALQSAPVIVANRAVIELRGPIAGYTADERARGAMERIEAALDADPKAEASYGDTEEGTRVRIGGRLAFIVTKIDIDPDAGETTALVAREAARRLEQAIAERREQRSPGYLLRAAGYAAVATLIYLVLIWGLVRAGRWFGDYFGAAADEKAKKLHVGSVRRIARRVIAALAWTLAALASVWWVAFVLERFPFTRRWGENLESNLVEILKDVALAIAGALPGLVIVAIIFVLARAVIGLVRVFFLRVEFGRIKVNWLDADTVGPTRRIFTIIVWAFAAAIAYPYLPGAQTEAFKGLSVLIGLMISLGGASVIGQAFSGLILMYTRVFRRNDYVRIDDVEGTITHLGMFATRIRTGLGEEVTLSNAGILAKTVKNFSRAVEGTGYVLDTVVTIGYATPWRQVEAMLLEAARRTRDIAQDPRPIVRQTGLTDFYVEYRLIAYTPLEHPVPRVEVLSHLHGHIQDVFNEYGVQIMSPHYRGDPKDPQVVPKDRWFAAPAKPPEK